jgi:hypothetical protein
MQERNYKYKLTSYHKKLRIQTYFIPKEASIRRGTSWRRVLIGPALPPNYPSLSLLDPILERKLNASRMCARIKFHIYD